MPVRITIITICFNNLPELQETCNSVDMQGIKPYEHWIIDGSTNSDISNWLKETEHPGYRYWISERDHGIADAFNKGILRATGDIVNMLNSGDCYWTANVLNQVSASFEQKPDIKWLHGKCVTERGGKKVVLGKPFDPDKLYRGMRSVWHQTMFLRNELHEKYGLYDTALNIAMDYDLLCRISGEPFLFLEEKLVSFAPHGISQSGYLESLRQMKQVYTRHFGKSILVMIWQTRLKILYYLLNSPVGKHLYAIKTRLKLENM